jgi:hypothetical protein
MRGGLNSIQDRGDASGRVPGASLFCILGAAGHAGIMGVKEALVASVPAVKRLLPVMKGLLQERFQEKRSLKDRGRQAVVSDSIQRWVILIVKRCKPI